MSNVVNMNFIQKNYKLPEWFEVNGIDWQRLYHYGDKRLESFIIYLEFLYYHVLNDQDYYDRNKTKDLSENQINDILTIKICDYEWSEHFWHDNVEYDNTNDSFILEKHGRNKRKEFMTEINETCLNKEIIEYVWNPHRHDYKYFEYLEGEDIDGNKLYYYE